ncbi:MAG: efflux RND transporter permease subunit, partial [Christensenellaceae bacterium]
AFMPEADSDQLSATLEMPEGSTTQQRRDMSAEVIDRILEVPDVETVGAMEGSGMMLSGSSDSVSYYIILKQDRQMSSDEAVKAIEEKTSDLDCTLTLSGSSMDLSALGGSGMDVVIEGDDLDTLRTLAEDMAELLRQTEGTTQIDDGLESGAQEIRVVVDKTKAMERNLTVAQVYQQVAAALQEENTATNVTLSNESMPVIVVENSGLTRENLAAYTWTVTDSAGQEKTLRLSDVAQVYKAEGFSAIRHDNQVRTLTVSCQIDDAHNIGLVSREFEKKLAAYETPAGYDIRLSGENETINNTLRDLVTMILLAVALIYLIMVAQFQSWMSPFIVIFTIPLAFTGGLLALWAARMEISMIAMLGFLMLSGVIVNNGIVFVDYVNQLRQDGMEKRDALLEAGKTRLRPILMTTLTTVLALVTLALGMGSGAEMLQPMAVVMIGGLTYATLMTLFVVPSLYDIFQRRPMRNVELEEAK